MTTLIETIRTMTGAADGDADDEAVQDALNRHRMRHTRLALCWQDTINDSGVRTYERADAHGWGRFEPGAQDAEWLLIATTLGTAPTGDWTLATDGEVVFAEDQGPSVQLDLELSAYTYDLNAAAAEIVDAMIAVLMRDYDVTLGDQKFQMSQAVTQLEQRAQRFRAKALPRVMRLVRTDEARRRPYHADGRRRRPRHWPA